MNPRRWLPFLLRKATPGSRPPDVAESSLWAGDLCVCAKPTRLTTVLGSCISVCLHDSRHATGGMNHFLLPDGEATPRHGRWATERLIERMIALGSRPGSLQAKLFGGGNPLPLDHEEWAVGDDNIAIARAVLAQHRIPIVAERVGTRHGLRVIFDTWSGDVWVRVNKRCA